MHFLIKDEKVAKKILLYIAFVEEKKEEEELRMRRRKLAELVSTGLFDR
jgi:hypothetical protein